MSGRSIRNALRPLVGWAMALTLACDSPGATLADAPLADATVVDAGLLGATSVEIHVIENGGLGPRTLGSTIWAEFPQGGTPDWHSETLRVGDCRLLEYEPGFCTPACEGVCVAPDECRPWPQYLSAGTLTFAGLTQPLALDPQFDNRYLSFGSLPMPLFQPSSSIVATASGADVPSFVAASAAVSPLVSPLRGQLVSLADGSDYSVTWQDPTASTRVRVTITKGGVFHGQPSPAIIECDAADTGSLVIPRAIIEAFPLVGVGCPKMIDCSYFSAMRYTTGEVTTSLGPVRMLVGSGFNTEVEHSP